jgi:hypothetical protein
MLTVIHIKLVVGLERTESPLVDTSWFIETGKTNTSRCFCALLLRLETSASILSICGDTT